MNQMNLEHPDITHCLLTSYPPWISDSLDEDGDEDDYFDDDEEECYE